MADILIKDIDIPKNGTITLVIHPNHDVYLGTVVKDVKIGTVIELSPHGNLKDENVIKDMIVKELGIRSLDFLCEAERVVVNCVEQAPIVLEASI